MNAFISVFSFVVVIAVVCSVIWALNRLIDLATKGMGTTLHCMTCGSDAKVKAVTKGSTVIELILWLCFLVPGLIYSVWRVSTRYKACGICGATNLVPLGSPAAMAHRKEIGIQNITS